MSSFDRLTPSEKTVAEMIALGYSNVEVADRLGITVKTYNTHRFRILQRLDLLKHGTAAEVRLTRLAIIEGFIAIPSADIGR